MDVVLFEIFVVFFADRAHKTEGDACRLLHHISQLPGEDQVTLPRHDIDLDLQGISAHLGPGKPPHNADLIFCIGF